MGNNFFQFKKFRIIQKKSAMKVGLDGVLLGGWVKIDQSKNILDVGSGTGLIALMLAQRSDAQITAIEIEKNSFDEAVENIKRSSWPERINIFHTSFQDYVKTSTTKYDLIVSNPPFFEYSKRAANIDRSNARHTDLLSYDELISNCSLILRQKGRIALIIPVDKLFQLEEIAAKNGFFIIRNTKVRPNPLKPNHRYLLELSRKKMKQVCSELTIENEKHFDYTLEYKNLTKDFYLDF